MRPRTRRSGRSGSAASTRVRGSTTMAGGSSPPTSRPSAPAARGSSSTPTSSGTCASGPARTVAARVRERGRLLDQDGSELACGFESEAQFAPLAAGLAERAATEIHAWREGFPSLRSLGRLPRRRRRGRRALARVRRRRHRRAGGRPFPRAALVRPRLRPPGPARALPRPRPGRRRRGPAHRGRPTAALDDDGRSGGGRRARRRDPRPARAAAGDARPDQALQAGGAIGSGPRTHATTGVSVSWRALTNARRSRRLRPRSASSRTTSASASPRWTRSTA